MLNESTHISSVEQEVLQTQLVMVGHNKVASQKSGC